ncbi:MAG: TIGR04325 family methyltransferase [Burkholderiaceae bacterium]|nr:TIGR04325 family methyltransferase [Burkholderiaceae bacterium]
MSTRMSNEAATTSCAAASDAQHAVLSRPRWSDRMAALPGVRAVVAAVHERRFVRNRDRNLFRGVFDTRESAQASSPSSRPVGYDNAESAALYLGRTEPDAYDYPAMLWLARRVAEGARTVFDVGGHFGMKYYAFEPRIAMPADLRWTVCDVPAVVQRGRAIAARRDTAGRLAFTDDHAALDGQDVLFASGVLQYLPMTLPDWLAGLRRPPCHLILNTTPLHPSRSFFTLNSIGTAFCPYRVQHESALFGALESMGYRRADRWVNPGKAMHIPTHPEHSLDDYVGACLVRG